MTSNNTRIKLCRRELLPVLSKQIRECVWIGPIPSLDPRPTDAFQRLRIELAHAVTSVLFHNRVKGLSLAFSKPPS
jgi:hypothetical protein